MPYKNNFMLLAAVDQGYEHIVKFLVEDLKVDVNFQSSSGESALHRACYRNRYTIAKYLVEEAGANMELQLKSSDHKKFTPIF